METKTVYCYDADNKYTHPLTLDDTDRAPVTGQWLIPANCTEIAPPEPLDRYNIIWTGNGWDYEEIPHDPEPEPHEPTQDEKIAMLDAQYDADKAEIMRYYTEALFAGDTDLQDELHTEMDEIDASYIEARHELEEE